ncbi:uncharacterized protein LOC107610791 [Arachis ipaensis]|uniref:uncharacterized protein LOC107610791 n=1 Tax=Arachis ipaensis TaxID=130454 RepID=UPI0007AEFC9A|nr:uncharacterized protein LOC107610791 [Arachis ipaensis]
MARAQSQCTQHRSQTEGCSKHGGDFVRLDESMNAALLKAQERKIDRLNIEIGRMEASLGRLRSDFTLLQQQIGRVESDMKKQKQLQKMILSFGPDFAFLTPILSLPLRLTPKIFVLGSGGAVDLVGAGAGCGGSAGRGTGGAVEFLGSGGGSGGASAVTSGAGAVTGGGSGGSSAVTDGGSGGSSAVTGGGSGGAGAAGAGGSGGSSAVTGGGSGGAGAVTGGAEGVADLDFPGTIVVHDHPSDGNHQVQ